MRKTILLAIFFTLLLFPFAPAQALGNTQNSHWCGTTSETENFGFTFDNGSVAHWTINGENYVSPSSINQVDVILDQLNADNIANTMILFIPTDDVSVGPSCAGNFLQYMKLGNGEGERADNGFAWLFMVKNDGTIEVHYSVGASLNSLYAPRLKDLNTFAEDTFTRTHSMDEALVQTIKAFDQYIRSEYVPYYPPTQTVAPVNTTQPVNGGVSFLGVLLLCIVLLVILSIGYLLMQAIFGKSTPQPRQYHYPVDDRHGSNDNGPPFDFTPDPSPRPSPAPHPSPHSSPTPTYHPPQPHPSSTPARPPSPPRSGGGSGKSNRVG